MDFETLASSNSIDKLHCSTCNNYLSYFPIFGNENQNICGRCPVLSTSGYFRMDAYEAVAQFVKFPCRNKNGGCTEKLVPRDMVQHEEDCPYKQITCPTVDFTQCYWEGYRSDILKHCQDEHLDKIMENKQFEINLLESFDYNNLLVVDNVLLIVRRQFDSESKMLHFSMCHIKNLLDDKSYQYRINLKRRQRNLLIDCNTVPLEAKENMKISLHSLEENGGKEVVLGKIELREKMAITENNNEEMTSETSYLRCSNCFKNVELDKATVKCSDCDKPYQANLTSYVRRATSIPLNSEIYPNYFINTRYNIPMSPDIFGRSRSRFKSRPRFI